MILTCFSSNVSCPTAWLTLLASLFVIVSLTLFSFSSLLSPSYLVHSGTPAATHSTNLPRPNSPPGCRPTQPTALWGSPPGVPLALLMPCAPKRTSSSSRLELFFIRQLFNLSSQGTQARNTNIFIRFFQGVELIFLRMKIW